MKQPFHASIDIIHIPVTVAFLILSKGEAMNKPIIPQIHFVDRPEVAETFADSIHGIVFDGQTMRIDLCTTRMDQPQPQKDPTARQYPVCRLVLPPIAAIDLYNKLQHILQALEKDGKITRNPPPPQATMQ